MGLREKVALLILVDFFVQLMYGQCLPNTNKWISFQVPYKKYKVRKKALPVRRPTVREGCVARSFNFPEVEYGLAPTPTSSLYSNINFDLNQYHSKPFPTPSKYSVLTTNEPESRKYKNNRKNNATDRRKAKKTEMSRTTSTLNTCLKSELFFPSVDYPLDVTDLWGPNYWNRFPQMQPEPKLDVIDMTINDKPKKEKAKITKVSRKELQVNKILNSCIKSKKDKPEALPISKTNNITKIQQNATDCKSQSKNLTGSVELINKESIIPTTTEESIHRTTGSCCVKNESENFQDIVKSDTTLDDIKSKTTSCILRDKKTEDIPVHGNIEQITTTLNVDRSYTGSTSTTSNIISFLTTVAPTIKNSDGHAVCDTPISSESLSNSTEVDNDDEDPQLPDDMGYTIMYPELLSSIGTSTMSPSDERIDNSWMYPDIDNHTFNSYSDEIEQCYILVP